MAPAERRPLHELAAAAPFAVFVPERVPDGWRLSSACSPRAESTRRWSRRSSSST